MAFKDASGHAILAAADKQGHVSMWQVGAALHESAPADDEDAFVLEFAPHKQFVSGLRCVF